MTALALDLTARRPSPQVMLRNSSNKFDGSVCAPGERWRPRTLRGQTHRCRQPLALEKTAPLATSYAAAGG